MVDGILLGPCCLGHTSLCKAVCLERAVRHFRKMRIFRVRVLALDLKICYFKGDYVKLFFREYIKI